MTVTSATEEILTIIDRADRAFMVLEELPRARRAELLRELAREVADDAEALVSTAVRETSLTPDELSAEVTRTVDQLDFFAGVVVEGSFRDVTIDHDDSTPAGDLRRVMGAVGAVGVFGPSNFPFAYGVLGTDVASALAAGCSVVVKAHPSHHATARRLHEAAQRVLARLGLPAGVVSLVEGFEAGVALVQDARVRAVGFVGSVRGGRALFDLCAGRADPIPFYGELGSLNTVVVLPGAAQLRTHEVADVLASSMLARKGQMCTKPGLAFVPSDEHSDRIVVSWAERVDAWTPAPLLDEAVRSRFVEGSGRLLSHPGVHVLAGAVTTDGAPSGPVSALLVEVSSKAFQADPGAFIEECFGPLAVVVRYDSDETLMALLAHAPQALVAGLHADVEQDAEFLPAVVRRLSRTAGRVVWAAPTTGLRVAWATHHGGRYPASTAAAHTAVGAAAIRRWLEPLCLQGFPQDLLPGDLLDQCGDIVRRVDGVLRAPISQGI